MSAKEYTNEFKFALNQEDLLLCEKTFDANQFNPFTRNSINIKDILPRVIKTLQKTLSKKSYIIEFERGGIGAADVYNLFQYNQGIINSYPKEFRHDLRYKPPIITQYFNDKTIRGVECKIGFYINDNTIVERIFYVDGFNPVARWSVDLLETVVEITDEISEKIRLNDISNMWDDYDLINNYVFTINQIRELPNSKRYELLRRLNR